MEDENGFGNIIRAVICGCKDLKDLVNKGFLTGGEMVVKTGWISSLKKDLGSIKTRSTIYYKQYKSLLKEK